MYFQNVTRIELDLAEMLQLKKQKLILFCKEIKFKIKIIKVEKLNDKIVGHL